MMMERQFRILWGPTLETVLDFSWPVVGDAPRVWRELRDGVERAVALTATDVSVTGKDFFLGVTAKWFDLPHASGAAGLQAFIDWANAGNAFTLVPDPVGLPTLTVPGCFLDAPFLDPSWSVEPEGGMTVDLVIRHPTTDLGLAWRGLFFEYVAGQSLTDPLVASYTRASVAYEIGPDGYLHQVASGVPADGHYPAPFVDGLQTTLLEPPVTNDLSNPEDLTNGAWTKTRVTITANNAKAPDQNVTADAVIEDTSVTTTHLIGQTVTIVAGDTQTVLAFVRNKGRYRGQLQMSDNVSRVFAVDYDLFAKTLTPSASGGGALVASKMTELAGGWFMIWMRGTIGGAATAVSLYHWLADATGSTTYTGDGVSGVYYWGVTAVHGVTTSVSSYTPTTGAGTVLKFPYTQVPQDQWAYVRFKELGSVYVGSGGGSVWPGIWAVGCTSVASPAWHLYENNANGHLVVEAQDTAGNAASQTSGVVPVIGDTVEVWARIGASGALSIRVSINGGAETVAGPSGALPLGLPSTWTDQFIGLGMRRAGQRGWNSIAVFKTGPYVATGPSAVDTIAAARAA